MSAAGQTQPDQLDAVKARRSLRSGLISVILLLALVAGLLLAVPGLSGVARTVERMRGGAGNYGAGSRVVRDGARFVQAYGQAMVFKRIVVGCDGSDGAGDAVVLAAEIARTTGAGLSLVGVYPTTLFPVPGSTDRQTLRRQALATLRRERDRHAPSALVHAVADISVSRALSHYAAHWHAGLIVIGSHSSAAAGHAAIGRHGRQLLNDNFSIALAARGLHERSAGLRTIAVGWDGGPESEAALDVAAALGRAADAELVVHTVVDDHVPSFGFDAGVVSEMWSEMMADERKAALVRVRNAAGTRSASAAVGTSVGDPGYSLREVAETADLMVVGSRRWGPIARLASGGVGETLVADCPSSVLIVPRPRPAGPVRNGTRAKQAAGGRGQ